MYGQRLRMTREDRERRKMRSRKVRARVEFLDNLQDTILAFCGVCDRRLGWWEKDDAGNWRSPVPLLPLLGADVARDEAVPYEAFFYSYSGYEDTGFEVHGDPHRLPA